MDKLHSLKNQQDNQVQLQMASMDGDMRTENMFDFSREKDILMNTLCQHVKMILVFREIML